MPPTKTITLSFEIPTTDTPSEVQGAMRSLLLDSLTWHLKHGTEFAMALTSEETAMCRALLTES